MCLFPLALQRSGSHLAWCLYECAALGEATLVFVSRGAEEVSGG